MHKILSNSEYNKFKDIEHYILNLKPTYSSLKTPKPFNIQRVRYILKLLKNPHIYSRQKYIHITGTSGKGSTAHIISRTLTKLGYKVGVFTSPHVTSIIERIQVNNTYISSKDFINIFEKIRPILKDISENKPKYIPSFFDILLIMAFIYFKDSNCDYIILEAGIGGMHDSTNIIINPLVTAITNIGIDHTEFLGNTKELIAHDKSGIIKGKSNFFTTEQNKGLLKIFKDICKRLKVPMYMIKSSINTRLNDVPNFHIKNTELARSISNFIDPKQSSLINEYINQIQDGTEQMEIQARFEILQDKPTIIIDGAHNVSKIRSVIEKLKASSPKAHGKYLIVLAVSKDKDLKGIVKQIIPVAHKIIITKFSVPRPFHEPQVIVKELTRLNYPVKNIFVEDNPQQALSKAIGISKDKDLILVTGSFYLASDIRKLYISEKQVLEHRRWK